MYAICQRTQHKLDEVGDYFGVGKRYADFNDALNDLKVDAIHIKTPIPDHASQSIAGL
jgi:predicted dehydrogenase